MHSDDRNRFGSGNRLEEEDEGLAENGIDDNDEFDNYPQFSEQQKHERSTAVESKNKVER